MKKVLDGDEPVGSIIRIQGKKYEVAVDPPESGCSSCGFFHDRRCEVMNCFSTGRKDGLEVVFIRRTDLEPRKHQKKV